MQGPPARKAPAPPRTLEQVVEGAELAALPVLALLVGLVVLAAPQPCDKQLVKGKSQWLKGWCASAELYFSCSGAKN